MGTAERLARSARSSPATKQSVTTTVATSAMQGLGVAGSVFEVVLAGSSVTVKRNGTVVIPTQTITE